MRNVISSKSMPILVQLSMPLSPDTVFLSTRKPTNMKFNQRPFLHIKVFMSSTLYLRPRNLLFSNQRLILTCANTPLKCNRIGKIVIIWKLSRRLQRSFIRRLKRLMRRKMLNRLKIEVMLVLMSDLILLILIFLKEIRLQLIDKSKIEVKSLSFVFRDSSVVVLPRTTCLEEKRCVSILSRNSISQLSMLRVHSLKKETSSRAIKNVSLMELLKLSNHPLFQRLWTTLPKNWLNLSKNDVLQLWFRWLRKKEEREKLKNQVNVKESKCLGRERMSSIKS